MNWGYPPHLPPRPTKEKKRAFAQYKLEYRDFGCYPLEGIVDPSLLCSAGNSGWGRPVNHKTTATPPPLAGYSHRCETKKLLKPETQPSSSPPPENPRSNPQLLNSSVQWKTCIMSCGSKAHQISSKNCLARLPCRSSSSSLGINSSCNGRVSTISPLLGFLHG